MTSNFPRLTIAVIAAIVGASAYADTDAGKTRDEVRAETMAAIRDGTIDQGNGNTARQMSPGLYPAAQAVPGNTRDQVEAELAQAMRQGDVDQGNGNTARQMAPGLYPPTPVSTGETRDQVKAELAQAIRTGDMPAMGRITMTRREEFPQLYRQQ